MKRELQVGDRVALLSSGGFIWDCSGITYKDVYGIVTEVYTKVGADVKLFRRDDDTPFALGCLGQLHFYAYEIEREELK